MLPVGCACANSRIGDAVRNIRTRVRVAPKTGSMHPRDMACTSRQLAARILKVGPAGRLAQSHVLHCVHQYKNFREANAAAANEVAD